MVIILLPFVQCCIANLIEGWWWAELICWLRWRKSPMWARAAKAIELELEQLYESESAESKKCCFADVGKQVCFSQSYMWTCYHWVPKQVVSLCTMCQQWGHHASRCHTNWMICSKCAGTHPTCNHDLYCDQCKTGNGHACQPKCSNCDGDHSSVGKAAAQDIGLSE